MKIVFDPEFVKKTKKINVRIRKRLKEKIIIFSRNPYDPQLHNHQLKREYIGYRSINITADWRALYKEISEGEEEIAYFILLGTHAQLYD
jgi:addiction module RelE/StbE family toxin